LKGPERYGGMPPGRTPERSVRIPEEVAADIESRIEGSGFASVDAFVAFVLARLLEDRSEEPFSEEDERRLRERLRSLGYID
jgi:Arc/MetJ-type ribon-helix-helix transcriptional regulator